MKLLIKRTIYGEDYTAGQLYINGNGYCDTLEPTDRNLEHGGAKIKGKTAIPTGTYKVAWTFSNKYQQWMPEILNVPQFEGVRIHGGNSSKDTEGCILVGDGDGTNCLKNSTQRKSNLWARIENTLNTGEEVTIEIVKI